MHISAVMLGRIPSLLGYTERYGTPGQLHMANQALLCAYICWRSFWVSARVDPSMPDTWQARKAYRAGPRGSQEYWSMLLPGLSCTCS